MSKNNRTTYADHLAEKQAREAVAIACHEFKRRGWFFEFRKDLNAWEIETPSGWRVAENARELCAVVAEFGGFGARS